MKLRNTFVLLGSAALLSVAGCAQQASSTASTVESTGAASSVSTAQLEEQQRKNRMLENELRERERALANLRAELDKEKSMGSTASSTMSKSGDLFPPNPRPGECYARVIVPAQYKTSTRTVVTRERGERIEIVPAVYEPGKERVLVKPASTRLVEVPAKYRKETERVLDKPAHTVWKRGTGRGEGVGIASTGGAAAVVERFGDQKVLSTRVDDTGEVMCLVEVPATYKTVTRQVLVSPATTKTVEIPAEYKTIDVMKLVKPATERRIAIPEETNTVSTTEKVTDEYIEWRPVLCEVNMTKSNVSALQAALNKRGSRQCTVDGIMGPCTLTAARSYADSKGLPAGDKYITIDVVRSLGLKF